MDVDSGYIPVEANAPMRGLLTSLPATRIDPAFSPNLLNVTVRDGIVRRRLGYLLLGDQLDGVVQGIVEFGPIGAAELLVVFTTKSQYYYDTATNTFIDISAEETSTYAINAVDNSGVVGTHFFQHNGADIRSAFPNTSKFVVLGSTGNDGTYTVSSTDFPGGNTTITVTEAIDDTNADGNMYAKDLYPVVGGNQLGKQFWVAGNVTADFATDDEIFVTGSDLNDGIYTVVSDIYSAPNTRITVAETIPDNTWNGTITIKVPRFAGDDDYVNFEGVTDTNGRRLLMTNGIDRPLQWTGDTTDPDHFMFWAPRYDSFVTCDVIRAFKEHLFLGGVQAAANEPQIIAWSDAGDFEEFQAGSAGVQLLYELTGGILGLESLGDRLIIYSADAIASGVFIGLPAVFAFETIIPEGTRLISPKSIVSINVGLVYASEENIYLFDGSRGLRVMSDLIYTDYKVAKDHENLSRVAAINDYSKKTIYLALPDLEGGTILYSLLYDAFDLSQRIWAKEKFANNVRAFGFFTNTVTVTWEDTADELIFATAQNLTYHTPPPDYAMTWEYEEGIWGNEGEQVNFPVRVFGDESGNVYTLRESYGTDNGTDIEGHYDTLDFTVPKAFLSLHGRWGEIEFEASGGSVDVYTSINKGASYQLADTIDLENVLQEVRVPIDLTARSLRVRFEFSEPFLLRWVRAWVRPTAAR